MEIYMLMRKYLSKGLYAAIYGYLILPFLIFSLGWLKIYIAIPIVLLLIICYFKICKESTEVWLPQMTQDNIIKILFIIGVIALWVYFSGIGKFVFQNTDQYLCQRFAAANLSDRGKQTKSNDCPEFLYAASQTYQQRAHYENLAAKTGTDHPF